MEETRTNEPAVTSRLFAILALRQHRLNQAAFRVAGLRTPRLTRQVALYLDCYRLHRERELEAAPPFEWMRLTLQQARVDVAAMSKLALESDDPAVVAGALARVEAARELAKRLAEAVSYPEPVEGEGVGGG